MNGILKAYERAYGCMNGIQTFFVWPRPKERAKDGRHSLVGVRFPGGCEHLSRNSQLPTIVQYNCTFASWYAFLLFKKNGKSFRSVLFCDEVLSFGQLPFFGLCDLLSVNWSSFSSQFFCSLLHCSIASLVKFNPVHSDYDSSLLRYLVFLNS